MPDGGLQRHAAPQGIAEDIGLPEFQVPDQAGDVVRHRLVGERPIDVGRMAVPLQIDDDDLPGPGEDRQELTELQFAGRQTAVEQDQRLPRAVDLEVELEAVDRDVAGPGGEGTSGLPAGVAAGDAVPGPRVACAEAETGAAAEHPAAARILTNVRLNMADLLGLNGVRDGCGARPRGGRPKGLASATGRHGRGTAPDSWRGSPRAAGTDARSSDGGAYGWRVASSSARRSRVWIVPASSPLARWPSRYSLDS